jgi:D-arabinan endo alpha-(1,5)-arabinofuranosidase
MCFTRTPVFRKYSVAFLSAFIGGFAYAQPETPMIKEVSVGIVCPITGPNSKVPTLMKQLDICGTDLGIMTEADGRIFFAFGDTFGYPCSGPGGPNWRSNTLGATANHNPANGVELTDWLTNPDGTAKAIIEGAHQPPFTGTNGEQTKIPTAMVTVGGRIYLHYMSVHGFAAQGGVWDCNYSQFLYSDDMGKTWTPAALQFGDSTSNFNMLALTDQNGSGNDFSLYVYAIGTPCGRFGDAKLGRVPKQSVLDPNAWQYYVAGQDQEHSWTANRSAASEIIPAPIGEGSILWDPWIKRWLFTYLNENTAQIELREAENPWGPWSVPIPLATAQQFPALYGAFMTPSFLKDSGKSLYFVMSMFGPYEAFLMKAELETYH